MNDEARELALTIANGGAFTDEDAVLVAQAYLETLPTRISAKPPCLLCGNRLRHAPDCPKAAA